MVGKSFIHRVHTLLAAQLVGQWRRQNAPQRLYETLAAISHHDDLEKKWEPLSRC